MWADAQADHSLAGDKTKLLALSRSGSFYITGNISVQK